MSDAMMWLFSRRQEQIRLNTWHDKHTSEFVVDIAHPGGSRDSKRFVNDDVFRTWLTAWDIQLAVQGWKLSGPFLSPPDQEPRPSGGQSAKESANDADGSDSAIVRRTYTTDAHTFEVTLSRLLLKEKPLWTLALVIETSHGKRLQITGIQAVVSSSPDETFARACDRIDKWLRANSEGLTT